MSPDPNRKSDATPNDRQLKRDPIESVRAHPGWFFSTDDFDYRTVLGLLMSEVFRSSLVKEAQVLRVEDWICVSADADWLGGDLESFSKPTLFVEGGVNATRVEVLLTAFCGVVVTASHGHKSSIRTVGESKMPSSMSDVLSDPTPGRVIVFQTPAEGERSFRQINDRMSNQISNALAHLNELVRRFQNA
jgi:hypothetical protein